MSAEDVGCVNVLKQVLADCVPDHGYFVIRPSTVDAVRKALAAAGAECPGCPGCDRRGLDR